MNKTLKIALTVFLSLAGIAFLAFLVVVVVPIGMQIFAMKKAPEQKELRLPLFTEFEEQLKNDYLEIEEVIFHAEYIEPVSAVSHEKITVDFIVSDDVQINEELRTGVAQDLYVYISMLYSVNEGVYDTLRKGDNAQIDTWLSKLGDADKQILLEDWNFDSAYCDLKVRLKYGTGRASYEIDSIYNLSNGKWIDNNINNR